MTDARMPRCRPVPPSVAEAVHAVASDSSEAALLDRLDGALAGLPADERAAVVAAHGYGEGAAGAAMETGHPLDDAEALTRSALQLLRAALEREGGQR